MIRVLKMRKQDFLDKVAIEIAANLASFVAYSEYYYSVNNSLPQVKVRWTSPWDIAEELWEERQKRYGNKWIKGRLR
jgi:hypothetical protein